MLSIRLPEALENRLTKLSEKTGRSKSYYARQAIEEHIDDLEDAILAEKILADLKAGRTDTVDWNDVKKELRL